MDPVFNDRIQLLYTDTDSLMYEMESEDSITVSGNDVHGKFLVFPQFLNNIFTAEGRHPLKYMDQLCLLKWLIKFKS